MSLLNTRVQCFSGKRGFQIAYGDTKIGNGDLVLWWRYWRLGQAAEHFASGGYSTSSFPQSELGLEVFPTQCAHVASATRCSPPPCMPHITTTEATVWLNMEFSTCTYCTYPCAIYSRRYLTGVAAQQLDETLCFEVVGLLLTTNTTASAFSSSGAACSYA